MEKKVKNSSFNLKSKLKRIFNIKIVGKEILKFKEIGSFSDIDSDIKSTTLSHSIHKNHIIQAIQARILLLKNETDAEIKILKSEYFFTSKDILEILYEIENYFDNPFVPQIHSVNIHLWKIINDTFLLIKSTIKNEINPFYEATNFLEKIKEIFLVIEIFETKQYELGKQLNDNNDNGLYSSEYIYKCLEKLPNYFLILEEDKIKKNNYSENCVQNKLISDKELLKKFTEFEENNSIMDKLNLCYRVFFVLYKKIFIQIDLYRKNLYYERLEKLTNYFLILEKDKIYENGVITITNADLKKYSLNCKDLKILLNEFDYRKG